MHDRDVVKDLSAFVDRSTGLPIILGVHRNSRQHTVYGTYAMIPGWVEEVDAETVRAGRAVKLYDASGPVPTPLIDFYSYWQLTALGRKLLADQAERRSRDASAPAGKR